MNKPFVLIGAELRGQDDHGNYERVSDLRSDLLKQGLAFVGVTNISGVKKSQLFLVLTSDEQSMKDLARKYGQKAILVASEGLNMEVVSTRSNGRTTLGRLVSVSQKEAKRAKFYITFVEEGKEYFYVTKKGANNE